MISPSMPRIIQVASSVGVSHGGTATSVIGLAWALQQYGYDVSVYSTDAANPGRSRSHRFGLRPEDLPEHADELDLRMSPVKHPYRWLYAPALNQALQADAGSAGVLHINGLFSFPQYAAWNAAKSAGVPYVVSTHGQLDPYMRSRGRVQKVIANRLWVKEMLKNAARIHCTTEEERDLISDISPATRRVVIPNGMHVKRFERHANGNEFREQFLAGSRAPLILNHGRISQKKGLDILIEAIAEVRKLHPDAILAIVGSDAEGLRAGLEDQARSLGMENGVIFTGELAGDDLIAAITAADVWALTSHTENFGIAVIEAMATGRPVIASRAVNLAHQAQDEGALLMVDISSMQTADAILKILGDTAYHETLSANGKAFAQRFDWMKVVEQYHSMYQSVLLTGTSA